MSPLDYYLNGCYLVNLPGSGSEKIREESLHLERNEGDRQGLNLVTYKSSWQMANNLANERLEFKHHATTIQINVDRHWTGFISGKPVRPLL